jgi:hypothetical protein
VCPLLPLLDSRARCFILSEPHLLYTEVLEISFGNEAAIRFSSCFVYGKQAAALLHAAASFTRAQWPDFAEHLCFKAPLALQSPVISEPIERESTYLNHQIVI